MPAWKTRCHGGRLATTSAQAWAKGTSRIHPRQSQEPLSFSLGVIPHSVPARATLIQPCDNPRVTLPGPCSSPEQRWVLNSSGYIGFHPWLHAEISEMLLSPRGGQLSPG